MKITKNSTWLVLFSIVSWSSMATVISYVLKVEKSGAANLLFWSFFFSNISAMTLHVIRKKPIELMLFVPARIGLLGVIGLFGWTGGLFFALEKAPAIPASLINYLWPLLMVILAPITGERFSKTYFLATIVGFIGAFLVITEGRRFDINPNHIIGYLGALFAAISWATYAIGTKRMKPFAYKYVTPSIFYSFIMSVIAVLINGGIHALTPLGYFAAIYLGLFPFTGAFICWDEAMQLASIGKLGLLSYLDPLFSTILLTISFRIPIEPIVWVGMILIVLSAAITEII
jgi:drug/metabolite transporter (DMT)-like permease